MSFPFDFEDFDLEILKELMSDFQGMKSGLVQVGPKKYAMPAKYREVASSIYNFKVHGLIMYGSALIHVLNYNITGTTLMQELVWLVVNDLNYQTAAKLSLFKRFPFIDASFMLEDGLKKEMLDRVPDVKERSKLEQVLGENLVPMLEKVTYPCFIKTHLPFSLLPPTLLDTCKTVYVARNPKDMVSSFYHHNRLMRAIGYVGDFPQYYDYFERNLLSPSPFWEHINEAWQLKDNPNLLFLFYEDLIKDMKSSIRKVADFFGKPMTEEQVERLASHLHIDNFRKNPSTNLDMDDIPGMRIEGEQSFIRLGKNGSWKAEFTLELSARADKWVAENLAKIPGFSFPKP